MFSRDPRIVVLSGSLAILNSDFWAGFRPIFGQTWTLVRAVPKSVDKPWSLTIREGQWPFSICPARDHMRPLWAGIPVHRYARGQQSFVTDAYLAKIGRKSSLSVAWDVLDLGMRSFGHIHDLKGIPKWLFGQVVYWRPGVPWPKTTHF